MAFKYEVRNPSGVVVSVEDSYSAAFAYARYLVLKFGGAFSITNSDDKVEE